MQCVLNATEKELIRNNHMNQINLYNPDIVQDNADLAELAAKYDNLDLPSADRRIVYLMATPPSLCRINNASTGYHKSRTGVIY